MRQQTYHLFEIVAWPALVWCSFEIVLRTVIRASDGLSATALTGALAGLTVVACRLRSRQLEQLNVRA